MGTRGLYGIRKNGIDKATYNHFDSYPEGLGKDIVKFCANNSIDRLERFFNSIEIVDENSKPTIEQINDCLTAGYTDLSVSTKNVDDWYCLLRNLQGNFDEYQKCIYSNRKVYMTDGIGFIKDSLFCEYAYIINLDDNVLEFYVGFQKEPQEGNRYGATNFYSGYYPCKLVATFPLDDLNDVDSVVRAMIDAVHNE